MTVYASATPCAPGGTRVYALEDGVAIASLEDITPDTVECHAVIELLDPRLDLVQHSPTGFSWGYSGSGPAQLALAILAHAGSDEWALEHYQQFKKEHVSNVPQYEQFVVRSSDLEF